MRKAFLLGGGQKRIGVSLNRGIKNETAKTAMRFFKYRLHNPNISFVNQNNNDFQNPVWIDDSGNEIKNNSLFIDGFANIRPIVSGLPFRNPYSLTVRSLYHGRSNRESRYPGCQRGRPQGIQRGGKKKHQASGRWFS